MERSLKRAKLSNLKKDFIELVQGISFKDILIFFLFPILITSLMFLPAVTRESLSLHIYNPKWWQFFTHAFIHKDFNHLWYNIQGYFVFGTVIFIFANKIKEKRIFIPPF